MKLQLVEEGMTKNGVSQDL